MIFIVKDEHNENRDKVKMFCVDGYLLGFLISSADDCKARHEYPYESCQ